MNSRVLELRKQIEDAHKELKEIEDNCSHSKIIHKEQPDCYNGWGVSERCFDCGKSMGCHTEYRAENSITHERVIER